MHSEHSGGTANIFRDANLKCLTVSVVSGMDKRGTVLQPGDCGINL